MAGKYYQKPGIFGVFQDLADRIISLWGGLVGRLTISTFVLSRTNTESTTERNHAQPRGGYGHE